MTFSVRRFKAVAQKEFLELRRNPLFFLMTVLAPLILFFLFAYGFPLDAKNIPMGVLDLDKSALSRTLLDKFEAGKAFRIKQTAGDYASLEKELSLGRIRAILAIPADFSRNLKRGLPVTLQILVDGSYPNRANLVSGYAEATIFSFRTEILRDFFIKAFGSAGAADLPIDLSVSVWYNPSFRSEDFIIPGIIAIIMMFFPPLVSAISLAKEKETGSILNMYCSSVTKTEYLLGKMTPYVLISYVNFLIFLLCALFIFEVPLRGDLPALLIVSAFYTATAVAMGLSIAVCVNTQIAAILITAMVTLTPSFLYSGFMVPVSSIGEEGRLLAYGLPATHYIDVARKIMVKGVGFAEVKLSVLALVGFCVGLYAISIAWFKKRLG
ncbi:MAG: ABC transporter permease [Candidatus Omnitrophica bacterium]|nr:ABC transporter permease [Candidatus Omnitrophota bacterium]